MPAHPPPARLPAPELLALMLQERLAHWPQVSWTEQSPSTNTELLEAPPPATPALLGTHWQHQGRGRAGRNFITPAGTALTFSCAFDSRLPIAALPTLGIWMAVQTCFILRSLVAEPQRLRMKWPNDLNWDDAKLAGMLLETRARSSDPTTRLVIGLGMNLPPGAILSPTLERAVAGWSDTGASASPADVVARICQTWEQALRSAEDAWSPAGGLAQLPALYAACDQLAGREVNLLDHGKIIASGLAQGVGTDGRLHILTEDGILRCSVGDISIRLRP